MGLASVRTVQGLHKMLEDTNLDPKETGRAKAGQVSGRVQLGHFLMYLQGSKCCVTRVLGGGGGRVRMRVMEGEVKVIEGEVSVMEGEVRVMEGEVEVMEGDGM